MSYVELLAFIAKKQGENMKDFIAIYENIHHKKKPYEWSIKEVTAVVLDCYPYNYQLEELLQEMSSCEEIKQMQEVINYIQSV